MCALRYKQPLIIRRRAMQVAVLGAGGKAGKELVAELLRRGHEVIAVGRNAATLPTGEGIEVREADVSARGFPAHLAMLRDQVA